MNREQRKLKTYFPFASVQSYTPHHTCVSKQGQDGEKDNSSLQVVLVSGSFTLHP